MTALGTARCRPATSSRRRTVGTSACRSLSILQLFPRFPRRSGEGCASAGSGRQQIPPSRQRPRGVHAHHWCTFSAWANENAAKGEQRRVTRSLTAMRYNVAVQNGTDEPGRGSRSEALNAQGSATGPASAVPLLATRGNSPSHIDAQERDAGAGTSSSVPLTLGGSGDTGTSVSGGSVSRASALVPLRVSTSPPASAHVWARFCPHSFRVLRPLTRPCSRRPSWTTRSRLWVNGMLLRIRSRRQMLVLPTLLALPGLVGGMIMRSLGLVTGERFKMLSIPGSRLLV